MKTFYFIAGLPRSGSTLLSSILNQNPDFHSSSNSPVSSAMRSTFDHIRMSEQYLAYSKPDALKATILGMLENYYSDVDVEIIFDKSREWPVPENLDLLSSVLPYRPKIIITVRDIVDILASFINLAHKNEGGDNMLDKSISTREFNFYRPADDIRCDYLMKPKGLIDNAMYGIANAMSNKDADFYFLEYENLVNDPDGELDNIYNFLEIPRYAHDLNNIINTVQENDEVYGLDGMHDVRSVISRQAIDKGILSDYVINKYSGLEFWR